MKFLRTTVVIVALAALTGCASLAGVFGIASKAYVNERMEASRAELSASLYANQRRIDENRSTIDRYAATANELEELMVSLRNSVQTTDELRAFADVLEERLENLPVDTIRQLVGILETYLEGK